MTASRRPSRRSAKSRDRKLKWLAVAIGVIAIAVALWPLTPQEPGAPPLDDIDEASRARLDAVLRQADREEDAR